MNNKAVSSQRLISHLPSPAKKTKHKTVFNKSHKQIGVCEEGRVGRKLVMTKGKIRSNDEVT